MYDKYINIPCISLSFDSMHPKRCLILILIPGTVCASPGDAGVGTIRKFDAGDCCSDAVVCKHKLNS